MACWWWSLLSVAWSIPVTLPVFDRPIFLGLLVVTEQPSSSEERLCWRRNSSGDTWLRKTESGTSPCTPGHTLSLVCDHESGLCQASICIDWSQARPFWLASPSLPYYPGVIGYWQPIMGFFTSASSVPLRQLSRSLF